MGSELFAVHMLTDQGKLKAEKIRIAFDRLLDTLDAECVSGREYAYCKTKLEEACFYAKKSMAKANEQ
jgi:hypothetical protein